MSTLLFVSHQEKFIKEREEASATGDGASLPGLAALTTPALATTTQSGSVLPGLVPATTAPAGVSENGLGASTRREEPDINADHLQQVVPPPTTSSFV